MLICAAFSVSYPTPFQITLFSRMNHQYVRGWGSRSFDDSQADGVVALTPFEQQTVEIFFFSSAPWQTLLGNRFDSPPYKCFLSVSDSWSTKQGPDLRSAGGCASLLHVAIISIAVDVSLVSMSMIQRSADIQSPPSQPSTIVRTPLAKRGARRLLNTECKRRGNNHMVDNEKQPKINNDITTFHYFCQLVCSSRVFIHPSKWPNAFSVAAKRVILNPKSSLFCLASICFLFLLLVLLLVLALTMMTPWWVKK